MGRMLAAGRLTATMRSKKTEQHITLTLECMKKVDGKWEHVSFEDASHVFIKQGTGGFGSGKVGTYYPSRKKIWWDSRDKAWQFAALHTFLAAGSGQQETSLYTVEEAERCGKCGRALTDPVSIARGIGPDCFGQLTGSVHYHQDEANLVDDLTRVVTERPSPVPGNRPIRVERTGTAVTVSGGTTNLDRKGREVPRTFEALAAAVKA